MKLATDQIAELFAKVEDADSIPFREGLVFTPLTCTAADAQHGKKDEQEGGN